MISLISLWMPILLSAALCWIGGAVIWMVLPHHKSDFAEADNEQGARDALRSLQPGQYNIPHIADPSNMTDQDRQKFAEGPVAFVSVLDRGVPNMGAHLVQQIAVNLIVATLVAYLASATLPAGTSYLKVFQVTGVTAWMAYGFATLQDSIWFGRPWSSSFKIVADALIYGVLTAGIFGWLWPSL